MMYDSKKKRFFFEKQVNRPLRSLKRELFAAAEVCRVFTLLNSVLPLPHRRMGKKTLQA